MRANSGLVFILLLARISKETCMSFFPFKKRRENYKRKLSKNQTVLIDRIDR